MPDRATARIAVVGTVGHGVEGLSNGALAAIADAALVVGGRRHLDALPEAPVRSAVIEGDVGAVLDVVAAEPGPVCVLASGDPGFFGMVRPLSARLGRSRLDVHPAPSSVSVAFARLGLAWDDAVVVSAHGRPLADAAGVVARAPKVAVLVSPDNRAEDIGRALVDLGAPHDHAAICSRLGLDDESVVETDLRGLAAGAWDPLAVVVLWSGSGAGPTRSLAWGLCDGAFSHRAGMITKAEVRAVALGKLDLPPAGVFWDVGAGSASVAIECARLAPGLAVHAVERSFEDAERIRANAGDHQVAVHVVVGRAPAALVELPAPDRVFVGGGGLEVLDAVLARLRPGGRVVATYAAIDRAVAATERLGSLVEVAVSRGERLADGGLRLVAHNPVFVVWGPDA